MQPQNGIKIKDWFGNDFADRHLLNLITPLRSIVQRGANDVRVELAKGRNKYVNIPNKATF